MAGPPAQPQPSLIAMTRARTSTRPLAGVRFAGLDGLRAIAVALVVIYHLFPGAVPGGFIGVDVFFVISGFLITALLITEWRGTGRIDIRVFWVRRARRLLPAVAVLVLVTASAALVVGGDVLVDLGAQVFGALTFSFNWVSLAAGSAYFAADTPGLYRNLWSLSVEEQFYLVWPVLVIGLLMIRSTAVRGSLVAVAGLASAAWMSVAAASGLDASRVYFGTDTHAFGLLFGASLAIFLSATKPFDIYVGETRFQSITRRWSPLAGRVALVGILLLAAFPTNGSDAAFRGGLAAAGLLTVVVIWAAATPRSSLGRQLDVLPLRSIGRRSYGIYLWHWPVYVLVSAAGGSVADAAGQALWLGFVSLALTVVAAWASFRFVEEPIRLVGFRGAWASLVAALRRGRDSRRPLARTLAVTAASLVLVLVAGAATAVVVAPSESTAERVVREGAEAIAAPPGTPSVIAPTPSSAASADEELSADPSTPTPPAPRSPAESAPGPESAPAPAPAPEPAPDPVTAPPAPAPADGSRITAVGDSVLLAASPSLQRAYPGIAIDAAVSRQMNEAPDLIESLSASGRLRGVVIVALGTNGPFNQAVLERTLAAAGPDRRVILVDTFAPRHWTDGVNQTIKRVATGRPNVVVASWHDAISPHAGPFLAADQIHPRTAGGAVYASVIADALAHLAPQ